MKKKITTHHTNITIGSTNKSNKHFNLRESEKAEKHNLPNKIILKRFFCCFLSSFKIMNNSSSSSSFNTTTSTSSWSEKNDYISISAWKKITEILSSRVGALNCLLTFRYFSQGLWWELFPGEKLLYFHFFSCILKKEKLLYNFIFFWYYFMSFPYSLYHQCYIIFIWFIMIWF